MLNATVIESTLQDIKSMTEPEFNERLNVYKELTEIAPDRKKLLFQFIRGALAVSPLAQFDIEQLLLKYLANSVYDPTHNCIEFEKYFYEYAPAKNGLNMVKHGFSFSEVVSFSTQFGTLSVPLPGRP